MAWLSIDNGLLLDIYVHDYSTGKEQIIIDPELGSVILATPLRALGHGLGEAPRVCLISREQAVIGGLAIFDTT